jgi:predicted ATPase
LLLADVAGNDRRTPGVASDRASRRALATMSLARLWQQQGKKDEVRQVLAEIYNWFAEGFDTADLQEAKALLEKLSH